MLFSKDRRSKGCTFISLLLLSSVTGALTQTTSTAVSSAEVTFYSESPIWPALAPVSTGVAFYGNLFDGNENLAYIEHGRFLTLRLAPGVHSFYATTGNHHPDKDSVLTIEVKPGGHYFIRASSNQKNLIVVPVSFVKGILKEVPCDAAQKEAAGSKPVPTRRIESPVRSAVNPATAFPTCP